MITFRLGCGRRPGTYAAALATVALGVGAMLAMTTSAAGAATTTPSRPSSADPAWSITPTPNPRGSTVGQLEGVSCTSGSACTALATYGNSAGADLAKAERWNGTTWAIEAIPSPKGATGKSLYGVSCTSASACTAVGYYSNASTSSTLAERWNGTTWAVQSTPTWTSGLDEAVSCTSASACTAVGYAVKDDGNGNVVTLAERWNGTTWAVQSTPSPGGSWGSYLDGVSCTSAWACMAVGYYYNASGYGLTLAERWNGTTWAVQSTPNPPAGDYGELLGVSCTSASACTAAGDYSTVPGFEGTLADRWNGTTWAKQSILSPSAEGSQIDGVSCTSASACVAAGYYYNSAGTPVTLAERWNGTTWAVQATPNPRGSSGSFLNGVSCTSASACVAAGTYNNSVGTGLNLAERYAAS
jgi:hypothetical protein